MTQAKATMLYDNHTTDGGAGIDKSIVLSSEDWEDLPDGSDHVDNSCPSCQVCRDFHFGLSSRELAKEREAEWKEHNQTPVPLPTFEDGIPLEATPERFRTFLASHYIRVRYDVRGMRQQVSFMFGAWEDVTDTTASIVREMLTAQPLPMNKTKPLPMNKSRPPKGFEKSYGWIGVTLDLPAIRFNELMTNACAHNPVDPLVEYLEGLPKWDEVLRLADWIFTCFEVAEESFDLVDWASQYVFLGAVWRAFEPGTKLDEMPVLIGKGGIGKSTALRLILPKHLQGLFTDGLNLSATPKERVEALQGKAIVEAAEMTGVRRTDMEGLKAFLSRTDDGSTRLAYRHNPEPMPRRCVLVGTADRPDPLPDDKNLRRFVPIVLNDGDVSWLMEYLNEDRGMLWAEALHLYRTGVSANLPLHLKAAQAKATETARVKDTIEDAVLVFLEGAPDTFKLTDIAEGIGIVSHGDAAKLTPGDANRISRILRHKGYTSKSFTIEGKAVRKWTKSE